MPRSFSLLGVLGLILGVAVTRSPAQAATVVLVRSPQPTAVAAEATVRLRGELVAAGFDVRVVDAPMGEDVRASLEEAASGPEVEAVVAILGGARSDRSPAADQASESAELWVIDRVTGKTVVRRVSKQAQSGHGAEVLSIRALELLRASFLEVALAASRAPKVVPQPAPPTEVTRWTDAAIADAAVSLYRPTWGFEVGACVIGSLEGLAPSVMPLARIQWAAESRVLIRVTASGLGTHPQLGEKRGRPTVSQSFGLLEGALRFRREKVFHPFLSLGVGAMHFSASGKGTWPMTEDRRSARWSFLADLGAGLHVSLGNRVELAGEVHAQVAQPYPVVRYQTMEVVTSGRPTLIGTLSLLAWM